VVAYAVRVNRARRYRGVAALLVATGVYLIAAGADPVAARRLLVVGIGYAAWSVILERREHR
jgi:hypothetical protein